MHEEGLRPSVFVVMPYGVKADPTSGVKIDFDEVWETAFRPAAEAAGVEPVRADEERVGGFVHLAMFERLLLAEIVLADLTLASPNVMYELGIRHATRPRATLSVFARPSQLPFDLSPIRALPYRLDTDGRLPEESRAKLVTELSQRFRDALTETSADSPLFQLIGSYPGVTLPHDVTETFQRRARTLVEYSNAIRAAPRLPGPEAIAQLRRLSATLLDTPGIPQELLIDVMLSYRDVEAHDEIIALADRLQPEAAGHPAVQQLIAFSLNRRARPGDDARAVRMLERLVEQHGADPETLGLLGRVHKDRHARLRDEDPELAEAALDAAIEAYERGFKADLRDYYPGINAVTLLLVKGGDEAFERARQLSPVVAFAVAARQGIQSRDYWDVATVLELAVINVDERTARRALQRLLYLEPPSWCLDTVGANLRRLQEALQRRGEQVDWLEPVLGRLRGGISRDL